MELAERGSLYSILKKSFSSLSLERKIGFASDCASALVFLHSRIPPVLHRDLKSPNVLISKYFVVRSLIAAENWTAKIADFGQVIPLLLYPNFPSP